MSTMSVADFEARYRGDPDPWGYTRSEYERDKYAATLAACGPGPFQSALELGSSIGVFSKQLASRCKWLATIDGAPTAVGAARHRLSGDPRVQTVLGTVPEDVPRRSYDLVVASEILYYLDQPRLDDTLAMIRRRLVADGPLVAVHWRPSGPDRPLTAAQVHAQLRAAPWLVHARSDPTDEYLLDVFRRR
jgi:Nodulation protein S (NodS)